MESNPTISQSHVDERRRFERVGLGLSENVVIKDWKGKHLGVVRQIGRGGVMIQPAVEFALGKRYSFRVIDDSESIHTKVSAEARYSSDDVVGFQFEDLSSESAVAILMGKYYPDEQA